jgi:ubiquinone biosynthesis protein
MAFIMDTISDIQRLREIVGVFSRYGFGEFFERINLGRFVPGKQPTPPVTAEVKAQRLLDAFQELGPTFIKLGQIASARPDALPPTYTKALQKLQDRVEPFSFAEVRAIIEAEFVRPLEELFDHFEEAPIASASIGQVHRAYTKDGRKVAVKIQRPKIDEQIRGDVNLLYSMARLIESVIDLDVGYTPTEIVSDFDRSMRMELDFTIEASNARKFRANFRDKPHIRFPETIDGLCGRRVMTMEFIEAIKISDAYGWPVEKRKLICDRFLEAGVQMMLHDGFFHGDPHPGNVFVTEDCDLIYLDLGLAGTIPKHMVDSLLQLIVAAAVKDAGTAARVIYRLGVAGDRINLNELKNDIQAILDNFLSQSWGTIEPSELLADFMSRGAKHGIKHPPELASLSKALLNVEAVVRGLYPELDLLEAAKPYAMEFFNEKMNFAALKPELLKKGYEVFGLLQDLPMQLTQLMMDMEKGKMNMVIQSEDIRGLQAALRSLAITLFFGMVTATFIVGGFIALAGSATGPSGLWVAGAAFLLSIVTAGFAFAWHIIAIRLRRPKLTELLGKRAIKVTKG